MQRKLLLFIVILISSFTYAQNLYWVGGSGNLSDGNHWSYTSGGTPSGISPTLHSNLIFDDNSSSNTFVVNLVGLNYAKSLICNNTEKELHFTGDNFSNLKCEGDFVLNEKTFYDANSKLIFSNRSSNYPVVNFWRNVPNTDVLFEDGTWNLQSLKVSDNHLLKFNKGNYKVINSAIIAGNLESSSDNVTFQADHSTFYVKNRIVLGNKVSFNSNDLILIAQKNNPALYQVNSAIDFGTRHKIFGTNPTPQACAITYSFTNPTCFGYCDASITVGFDAGCNTGPYDLIFNTSATCLPAGINGVMPPAVTLNSLCACGGNLLDIFVFDVNGFVTQTVSVNTPQNPTPVNLIFSSPVQPRCFGLCDGTVNIFTSGGSSPYNIAVVTATGTAATYTNVPPVTTTTVTGLCAGTYSFVVTDSKGCGRTFITTMTQPTQVAPNAVFNNINCNTFCNGSATSAPSGGVGPYTFTWTAAASTPSSSSTSSIGSLCPGTVSLTIADSKTCTATTSTVITQPPAITLTVTKTNLNCATICNGTASITATGGSGAGYTYTWTPMGSGAFSNNLCAGAYTVDVADNLNCTKQITFTLTAPPTLTAAPTQTNILCNGANTGAINLNTSGGTPGYTYSWLPSVSSTVTATNLPAGVYSFTITDALLCPYTSSVTLTEPPAITLTVTKTDARCFGSCDGTAIANMSGGLAPYSYTWTPGGAPLVGQGTSSVSGLCAQSYTLNVRDANNCTRSITFVITEPPTILPNVTSVQPTCNSLCNGSINSAPTGGTGAPYTFTLIPSVGAPIIASPPYTNLCAGTYTLLIGDNGLCVKTQTVSLTQPNPLTLSLNATPLNCFNQCNSTISSVIGGGSPGYVVTWGSGPSPGTSQSNQCAGVHTATVTDSKGCQQTASVNIVAPPDMTVTITPTQPNCSGMCTGVATATVSGGTPNYGIVWSTGGVGNVISNLCQGTYTATVTDNKGCVKTQSVDIIAPPALTLTPTNGTVSCAGSCDGIISVTATGGTPGYFYNWNSIPAQTTPTATGLCVGNYNVSVTDSKGCLLTTSANVTQPSVLTASISNVQASCNVCIGAATANGTGGTAPYTYSWSPGGQTIPNPTNLCVGPQTVTITDSRGCVATQTVQINQTVILLLTSNGSTLACNGACSGVSTANASGGVAPYTYTWTSPAPTVPTNQSTQTANSLCVGIHSITVADVNGCSNSGTVSFVAPPAITLTVNKTDAKCNGVCNGSITASASGGTGTLTYLWQPGGSTATSLTNLCAGDYTVIATDANGCAQTQVVTITQPSSLTATFNNTNPTTCPSSDGILSFVPSGGTPGYTFTWTPGGSVNPLVGQPDGTYVLNLTDANGCTQSFTTSLSDPLGPTVTVTSNSTTCFGLCNGSATLSITGTPPFNVNWAPPVSSTNTIVTNLCAGVYVPQVTDGNSCVTNQTVNIAQPTQITSSGIVSNLNCNTVCSGSINLSPSGGTPPYSFTWTPSGSGEDPTGLCANNYTVNIADVNNCPATNTFVITQPSTLTLSFNKKDVLCNGGCTGGVRAVVGGGATPYSYTWTPVGAFVGSSLDTIINLCTGVYSVSVTDANGCVISGTVNIGQPTALTSTITSSNVKCNGQCNGSAIINPTGGTIPYVYSFNTTPATPTQSVGSLCIGTYSGTVTDANGCVSSNSFVISQPLPIVITTTVSNPKCNAVCDGSVATTVIGGNPNYSYSWIPAGAPIQNPTGLCAGNYTLIVTDDSLCIAQALVTLVNPPTLVANITFTNPTCNGGCNGIVSASGVGGTSPYTYSWAAPTNTNQTVSGLCAGNYTIVVSDVNLCQNTQTIALTNPPSIALNPGITPANCGVNDGSINAVAVGGTPNYTYNWLPPVPVGQATNTLVTGLGAGVYTVIVTDAAACSATISVPLSNSNGPSDVTITSTNVACNGQSNGAADLSNPVGGTPSYTLSWVTPLSASPLITGLGVGTYTAQVIDANNCLYFESITIAEPQLIDDNEIITSALCFGNCNGSIGLSPTGGNGGYTYAWNNAATTQTVSNLCPGNYSVTITDVLGCTFTANYNLPGLISITSSTFATNNICFSDCNGTLLATNVAGGTPPYNFNWSDPLGQSTPLAIGLCTGPYSVTITDANGCFSAIPSVITSPSQVTFTPNITQPSCDMCNGVAVVNPTGGTPTYTLVWSNAQTGTTASNLCAGVYMVQITDGNGCLSNTNVVINSSSGITGEVITQTDESCASACDGTVTITAVGGVAPISYHWVHNNSTSQTLNGLCAGTYFCNMTDANGCTRTASVVIGAAVSLSVTSQVTQSSCTASTGSVVVNVSGGTGVYTYVWAPASVTSITNTATGLPPGSYTLTVSDGNGCSQTQVYSIGTINGPVITYKENDITCAAVCNGSIDIVINLGTPGYTTTWSNGASGLSINGLCAGSYSVLVTDNAGCTAVQNFSINSPVPIIFSSPDLDSPTCHDDCNGSLTALPVGGSLPYTFSWTPTSVTAPTTNSLCAGNYSITITDANGCVAVDSYSLINPPTLTLTAVVTDASCNTTPDGAIDVTNGGGAPPYVYNWVPGNIATQDLTNVLSGTYTLTITDNNGNGCALDTVLTINATVVVNAIAGNDTSFCQNGTLDLDGSNSNGGITYQWSELPLGTVISNTLIATVTPATGTSTYVLVATNGACVDSDTILVTSNPLPNVDAGPMIMIPLLTSSPIGGSPTGPSGSTFTWSPSGTLDNPSGTNPTTSTTVTTQYTVTVTDANGCMNSDTVTVFVYPEVKIPNGFSPNADGKNDTWMIDFIQQFPDCEVEVYNRWGEQLFYSKGYPIPWNGQYKNKELPVGTYYYIINLNHPAYPDAYTGPLTIFR